jgi:hypothetical protein
LINNYFPFGGIAGGWQLVWSGPPQLLCGKHRLKIEEDIGTATIAVYVAFCRAMSD